MYFLRHPCVFFSISLLFIVIFVFYNVIEEVAVHESRVFLFTLLFVLRALFHGFDYMFTRSDWPCNVCPCMCVVDFCCSACFFLLYSALVLIFWSSFSFLVRSVGVFMRVFVSRVSFVCPVRVFRVLLRVCCVFVVSFVF